MLSFALNDGVMVLPRCLASRICTVTRYTLLLLSAACYERYEVRQYHIIELSSSTHVDSSMEVPSTCGHSDVPMRLR